MEFVAAGFDLAQFWRLTPRSCVLIIHGLREGERARRVGMAEAVRAGARLDADDFEKWVLAMTGRDHRLPPETLDGMLRRASRGLEEISMDEALKRMH